MKRLTDEELAEFQMVDPQESKAWMINRIADLIIALKAERHRADIAQYELTFLEARFPCDGGCSYTDGPEETCSRDGRTPRDLWDLLEKARVEYRELAEHRPSICQATHPDIRQWLRCNKCEENYPCMTVLVAAGEVF